MIDTAAVDHLRQTVRDIREYYKANKAWRDGIFTLSLPIVRYLCADIDQSTLNNVLEHLEREGDIYIQRIIADPTVLFTDAFLT